MNIEEAEKYAYEHPAESGRISQELTKVAATCAKIQVQYTVNNVFSPNLSAVTVKL